MKTFQFTSELGRRFVVRLIDHEDPAYHEYAKPGQWLYQQPQIVFLDNQTGVPRPIGASYYIGTFLGKDRWRRSSPKPWEAGLCLSGGYPEFNLTAEDGQKVKDWLDRLQVSVDDEPEDSRVS